MPYIVRLNDESLFCFYSAGDKKIRGYSLETRTDEVICDAKDFAVTSDGGNIFILRGNELDGAVLCRRNAYGKIFSRTLKAGQLGELERLDEIAGSRFRLLKISGAHHLLFYQNRDGLGYREITASQRGELHIFHSANFPVTDFSFLVEDDALHTLVSAKTPFGSRIVYRKKESAEFSAGVILAEPVRAENCLLLMSENKLHAFFATDGAVFECVSRDGGLTFSRAERYRKKICLNPAKAGYVSAAQGSSFRAGELYVDPDAPWDVQLTELCENFYAPKVPEILDEESADELREKIALLQNQVEMLERQNSEKTAQLMRIARRTVE